MPTAGLRHAPDFGSAIVIRARSIQEAARAPRKPSFVGLVFLVFTSRLITQKTKVTIAST